MSDTSAECKERHVHLDKLWNWFQGNGNHGAGERLIKLEDQANGKEDCTAMKQIKDHLIFHKESKTFMWATMIPVYLMLLVMLLQIVGVIK